jgi:hypothetical protein
LSWPTLALIEEESFVESQKSRLSELLEPSFAWWGHGIFSFMTRNPEKCKTQDIINQDAVKVVGMVSVHAVLAVFFPALQNPSQHALLKNDALQG